MRLPAILAALAAVGAALAVATARAEPVEVPVDVGIGPAAYFISGPVYADQPVHWGVKLSVAAVLDQAFIRQHQDRIPPRRRKMARNVSEVRVAPSLLIPDALFISPQRNDTGIFGATFRPVAVNLPLSDGANKLRVGVGLLLTYFYLRSDTLPSTHFLRPGADVGAELEIATSPTFLISLGWSSGFYIPQKLGSFGTGSTDESIWHIGQAYLKLHWRFPRRVNL